MARHAKPVHNHHYNRLIFAVFAVLAALFLTTTAASAKPAAKATADYHAGYYRHLEGTTYQVWLVGWAPSSEYTLFKKAAGSSTFNEVANSTRAFDNEVVFNTGVRNGTTLEIDVWNGQQTTTSFYFVGDDTVAAPAGATWSRMSR